MSDGSHKKTLTEVSTSSGTFVFRTYEHETTEQLMLRHWALGFNPKLSAQVLALTLALHVHWL